MKLYYFTGAQHALSNIALKRIKISEVKNLNDPYELSAIYVRDPSLRENRDKLLESFDGTKGIICFSDNYQSPLMWGHYAAKHSGICLGFEVSDEHAMKVEYISDLLRFERKLEIKFSDAQSLLCSKYKAWEYEMEYRVFVSLEDKQQESGLFFEKFSEQIRLDEVIIGPRCDVNIDDVRGLLKSYSDIVHVKKARLAFTKFSVVEDRSFRPSALKVEKK